MIFTLRLVTYIILKKNRSVSYILVNIKKTNTQ